MSIEKERYKICHHNAISKIQEKVIDCSKFCNSNIHVCYQCIAYFTTQSLKQARLDLRCASIATYKGYCTQIRQGNNNRKSENLV